MFAKICTQCLSFARSEDAVTSVEYAVLLAVIIIAAISGIMGTGDAQKAIWADTATSLDFLKE
jgi:Flp pilus assembly pilin Flp